MIFFNFKIKQLVLTLKQLNLVFFVVKIIAPLLLLSKSSFPYISRFFLDPSLVTLVTLDNLLTLVTLVTLDTLVTLITLVTLVPLVTFDTFDTFSAQNLFQQNILSSQV